MGKLIYSALTSLDGYVSDNDGRFDWAMPSEEVHQFVNDLESVYELTLYGKNMYQVMSVWEDMPNLEDEPGVVQEYARIWKKMRKIVFSKSLAKVATSNTMLKKQFVASEVKEIVEAERGDVGIGGSTLASVALDYGIVDEIVKFASPVLIGSGKPWITTKRQVNLEKIEVKEFANGVVMSRYLIRS